MDLKTRSQWDKALGREWRLKRTAVARGKGSTGGNLYAREDYCLAADQVEIVLTPEEKAAAEQRLRRIRAKAAAKRKEPELDQLWAELKMDAGY